MAKRLQKAVSILIALMMILGVVDVSAYVPSSSLVLEAEIDGGYNNYTQQFDYVHGGNDINEGNTGKRLIESIFDVKGYVTDTAAGVYAPANGDDLPTVPSPVKLDVRFGNDASATEVVAKPLDLDTYSYDWIHDNPAVVVNSYDVRESKTIDYNYSKFTSSSIANILDESYSFWMAPDLNARQGSYGAIIDLGQVAEVKYLQVYRTLYANYGNASNKNTVIKYSVDGVKWYPNDEKGLFWRNDIAGESPDLSSNSNAYGYWSNLTFNSPQKMRYITITNKASQAPNGCAIRAWGEPPASVPYSRVALSTYSVASNNRVGDNYTSGTDVLTVITENRDIYGTKTEGTTTHTPDGLGNHGTYIIAGDTIGDSADTEDRSYIAIKPVDGVAQIDRLRLSIESRSVTEGEDKYNVLSNFSVYVKKDDTPDEKGTLFEVYRNSLYDGDAPVNTLDYLDIDVSDANRYLGGIGSIIIAKNTQQDSGLHVGLRNIVALKSNIPQTFDFSNKHLLFGEAFDSFSICPSSSKTQTVNSIVNGVSKPGKYILANIFMDNNKKFVWLSSQFDENDATVGGTNIQYIQADGETGGENSLFYRVFNFTEGQMGYIKSIVALTDNESPIYKSGAKVIDAQKWQVNVPGAIASVSSTGATTIQIEDYADLSKLNDTVVSIPGASAGKALLVHRESGVGFTANNGKEVAETFRIPVRVEKDGVYTFKFGASWNGKGSKALVKLGGKELNVDAASALQPNPVSVSIGIPAITNIRTYDYSDYPDGDGAVELSAGAQYIEVQVYKGNSIPYNEDAVASLLDYITITPIRIDEPIVAAQISDTQPTVIEGENYTKLFGPKAVVSNGNFSGGKAVVLVDESEGIEWNLVDGIANTAAKIIDIPINVAKAGTYKFSFNTSWNTSGAAKSAVILGGKHVDCDFGKRTELGNTGIGVTQLSNLRNYEYTGQPVELSAGAQNVRFVIYKGGSDYIYSLLDSITITPVDTSGPVEPEEPDVPDEPITDLPTLTSDKDLVLEVEDYVDSFKLPATVVEVGAASGGKAVKIVKSSGVSFSNINGYSTADTLTIPIYVRDAGTYTFSFGTSWNGNGSKTLANVGGTILTVDTATITSNQTIDIGETTLTNLRTYDYGLLGTVELAAGEQNVSIQIYKGDKSAYKLWAAAALLDCLTISPYKEPVTVSGTDTTTIEFEDYVDNMAFSSTVVGNEDFSGEEAVFVSQDNISPAYKTTYGGAYMTNVVKIPITVEKTGTYNVVINTCWQGSGVSTTGYNIAGNSVWVNSGNSFAAVASLTIGDSTYTLRRISFNALQGVTLTEGANVISVGAAENSSKNIRALLDSIIITPVQ